MTQPILAPPVQDLSEIDAGPGPAFAVLSAAEAAIASLVLAAYTQWLAELSLKLFAVLPINPTIIWSLIPSWERLTRKLMLDLENIARTGWEDAARDLGVDIPYDRTNPVLQDQLRRTRNFLVRTPDDVYTMILRVLDKHAGDLSAQTRAVHDVLNITGTENWAARAKTVAVTEVHRAYNFGSLALAMNAGRGVIKTWRSKDDAATRPAHFIADGQSRPAMAPFTVGFEALMAPGDPSGSAWNVINCRCKLSYLRSRSGR